MKIVLATTIMDRGGVWTNIRDLARALAARGDHVVIATAPESMVRDDVTALGMDWLDLAVAPSTPADVLHVHLHDTFDLHLVRAVVATRLRRGAPAVVLTEHLPRTPVSDATLMRDPTLPPARRKPAARTIKTVVKLVQFAAAHHVVAVSASSADFLTRRYRLRASKISVVHNGVDVRGAGALTRDASRRPGPLRVVAIGALGWRKGFDVLIDAAALATRPWTVDVFGDGPLRGSLARAGATVEDRIRFRGWEPDVLAHVPRYDVSCLPSRGEAFPYTVLETMARGLPAVATRVDGVPEVVGDGVNGVLVEPADPVALAAALDRMADLSAPERAELGRAAAERVARSFTLDAMVEKTVRVYETTRRRSIGDSRPARDGARP